MMKKTIIALAITGSLVISGVVGVAAKYSAKQDILSSQEISKKALSYVKGKVYKVELDHENMGPVYEVEVKGPKAKYELKLDAKTGELLKKSTEYYTTTLGNKFIGLEKAKQIVLKSVKGTIQKAKFDKEDSVYEIEIIKGKYEYEFDIDAYTGKILKKEKTKFSSKSDRSISLSKAKQIALSSVDGVVQTAQYHPSKGIYIVHVKKNAKTYELHIDAETGRIIDQQSNNSTLSNAGLSIGNAEEVALNAVGGGSIITSNLDSEDGVYEVKVRNGKYEYELEIDATSGEILKQQKEAVEYNSLSDSTALIGVEKAKQIALSKVSGTISSATYDQEDGVYEVSVISNGYGYDFDINAQTGEIIKQEQEKVDNVTTNNNSSYITSQQASQIALSKVKGTVTKIDLEDGVYEVEIKDGTYEYELEIDAQTGEVLSLEKDYED